MPQRKTWKTFSNRSSDRRPVSPGFAGGHLTTRAIAGINLPVLQVGGPAFRPAGSQGIFGNYRNPGVPRARYAVRDASTFRRYRCAVLSSDTVTSALVVTALLAHEKEMDQRVRCSIISSAPPFDTDSPSAAMQVLADAFDRYAVRCDPTTMCRPRRVHHAALAADRWQRQGVRIIAGETLWKWKTAGREPPPVLFARGDQSVLSLDKLAVLTSRGLRRITPDDPWLIAIKDQFRAGMAEAQAVVSSFGTPGYDIVSCMAAQHGLPLVVICNDVLPFMKSAERTGEFLSRHEGMFDPDRTLFVSPFAPGPLPPIQERSAERDRLTAQSASFIAAAAVREGGNMEAILTEAAEAGVPITVFDPDGLDDRFDGNRSLAERSSGIQIYWTDTKHGGTDSGNTRARSPVTRSRVGRVLRLRNWAGEGYWLTHYTRACAGPWPGQRLAAHYGALIEARGDAGHSGFDTLRRILDEGLIRAGDRFTRGRIPVVSFTECLPGELAELVEWRRGLIRWSFEPYAVAVKKDSLVRAGAGSVIYGDEELFGELPEEQRFLFQLQRPGGKDWTREKEWRVLGDLRLDALPSEDVTVIVPTLDEAWIIHDNYHFEVTLAGIDWKGPQIG